MKVWNEYLYPDNEKINYTVYLQENSKEIDMNRTYPLVIVCPGGGYVSTSDREAEPVALGYLTRGYHVIVLRYTTTDRGNPKFPQPMFDLARLMLVVHEKREEWLIQTNNIFLTGFSAGAHLCLSMAVHWNEKWLSDACGINNPQILQPRAVVLGYPLTDLPFIHQRAQKVKEYHEILPEVGISRYQFIQYMEKQMLGEVFTEEQTKEISPVYHVTKETSPVFVWATATDELVFIGNTLRLGLAMEEQGVPFEMHIFQNGPHGMSMANESSAQDESDFNDPDVAQWFELACRFLKRNEEKRG